MLESVRAKLFDEWMPEIRLESVVSPRTWQPGAPRCSVCTVGFVRFRSTIAAFQENPLAYIQQHGAQSISTSEANTSHVHLCLACAVRKELFVLSKSHFSTKNGSTEQLVAWPFMHRKNVKAATLPKATFSFLTGPTAVSSVEAVKPLPISEINGDNPNIGEAAFAAADNLRMPLGTVIPSHLEMGSTDSVSAMSLQTGLSSSGNIYDQNALILRRPRACRPRRAIAP